MKTTRKSVVRRFLKNNYRVISGILGCIALVIIAGIVGYVISDDYISLRPLLPIHIPMMIGGTISGLLGIGLALIYRD